MKKRAFSFFILLLLLSLGVIFTSFVRYYLQKQYWIQAEAPCDPSQEVCFIYECDPETEECTGNPEEDISYYKIIHRVAADTPLCDPEAEDCNALSCADFSPDICQEELCDPEVLEEGQSCTNPEEFQANMEMEDGLESDMENAGEEGAGLEEEESTETADEEEGAGEPPFMPETSN